MATVAELLLAAIQRLRRSGCETPALDARLWLAHVCRCDHAHLLSHPEQTLGAEQLARFQSGIARLADGEPLPHLTGRVEFYRLPLAVTSATLIPRPETEHLVEAALEVARPGSAATIADVGTGSGCVAVVLAVHRPDSRLFAVDISPAALEVAKRNATTHGVAGRISFLAGSLLEPLPQKVDLIVANLPYVADDEWEALPRSVRRYEPAVALRGGPHGLKLIRALLQQAPAALRPGGAVLLEIGAAQGHIVSALARDRFPAADVQLHSDYAARDRLVAIQTRRER